MQIILPLFGTLLICISVIGSSATPPPFAPTATLAHLPSFAAPSSTIIVSPIIPSEIPTLRPNVFSFASSIDPSVEPSDEPSIEPYFAPSFAPSDEPSTIPSFAPSSISPSAVPSAIPTSFAPSSITPSAVPSTFAPSFAPIFEPSVEPSDEPSIEPNFAPSFAPSDEPSTIPSFAPSSISPSAVPSAVPSFARRNITFPPNFAPNNITPSDVPSTFPSFAPSTITPSAVLSTFPSFAPSTIAPSAVLSTFAPSFAPSTITPSLRPTVSLAPSSASLVQFAASQLVQGISLNTYSQNTSLYNKVFQESIADCMDGISPDDIANLAATTAPASRRMLSSQSISIARDIFHLTDSNAILLSYIVTAYTSSTYSSLSAQLNSAIQSGAFNDALSINAQQAGATALNGCTSSSVSTTVIDNSPSSSDGKSGLTLNFDYSTAAVYVALGFLGMYLVMLYFLANIVLIIRSKFYPHVHEFENRWMESLDFSMKCALICSSLFQLYETYNKNSIYILMLGIVSKLILFGNWVYLMKKLFSTVFLTNQHFSRDSQPTFSTSDVSKIPLSEFLYMESFADIKVRNAFTILAILTMFEGTFCRLFPWKQTIVTQNLNGYPTVNVFRNCLYCTICSQIIQLVVAIVNVIAQSSSFTNLFISLIVLVITVVNLIKNIIALLFQEVSRIPQNNLFVMSSEMDNFVIDDRGIRFSTSVNIEEEVELEDKMYVKVSKDTPYYSADRYADETIAMLKAQLLAAGIQPMEYIPLEDLQLEINSIIAAMNADMCADTERLDYLLRILDKHPGYLEQQRNELLRWKEEINPIMEESLSMMRSYVPPYIFQATQTRLVEDDHMQLAIVKRLLNKKCLWLVRVTEQDIARIHIAELKGRFNYEGQGLDYVELMALFAVIPSKFALDSTGEKEKWRKGLETTLKQTHEKKSRNQLTKAQLRNPIYKQQEGLYGERSSVYSYLDTIKDKNASSSSGRDSWIQQNKSSVGRSKTSKTHSSSHTEKETDDFLDIENGQQKSRSSMIGGRKSETADTNRTSFFRKKAFFAASNKSTTTNKRGGGEKKQDFPLSKEQRDSITFMDNPLSKRNLKASSKQTKSTSTGQEPVNISSFRSSDIRHDDHSDSHPPSRTTSGVGNAIEMKLFLSKQHKEDEVVDEAKADSPSSQPHDDESSTIPSRQNRHRSSDKFKANQQLIAQMMARKGPQ